MDKAKDIAVWIAAALVALYVGAGGIAKLLGVPYVHSSFPKLGLPAWFGYCIGVCEVLGSIGLFVRPLSALAAMGIGIIMVGATYYHATYTPIVQAAPAFILAILCAYIFLKRRADILNSGEVSGSRVPRGTARQPSANPLREEDACEP
jgi:hypothetical protein